MLAFFKIKNTVFHHDEKTINKNLYQHFMQKSKSYKHKMYPSKTSTPRSFGKKINHLILILIKNPKH